MINSVRNTVLAIINKNNYGYISPSDFNLFAKQAQLENVTIKEIALKETDFSSQELDKILNPESMTDPKSAPSVSLG